VATFCFLNFKTYRNFKKYPICRSTPSPRIPSHDSFIRDMSRSCLTVLCTPVQTGTYTMTRVLDTRVVYTRDYTCHRVCICTRVCVEFPKGLGFHVHPRLVTLNSNCVVRCFCAPCIRKRFLGTLADQEMVFWYHAWFHVDISYTLL